MLNVIFSHCTEYCQSVCLANVCVYNVPFKKSFLIPFLFYLAFLVACCSSGTFDLDPETVHTVADPYSDYILDLEDNFPDLDLQGQSSVHHTAVGSGSPVAGQTADLESEKKIQEMFKYWSVLLQTVKQECKQFSTFSRFEEGQNNFQ